MSKAARIRALYAEGKTTREIADEVGCRPEYVRVVARQRDASGRSAHDDAYLVRKYGSLKAAYAARNARTKPQRNAYWSWRWHNDPTYREAKRLRRQAARQAERISLG